MKLIKEQINFLKTEIEELKIKIAGYEKYLDERKLGDGGGDEVMYSGDAITESQINQDLTKLNEYQKILDTATCVSNASDKIDIGSKFKIKFDDSNYVEEYTLVETVIGNFMVDSLITSESILGKSLLNKKENDRFSYNIGNTSQTISGVIIEIDKNFDLSSQEKSYIRNIQKSHRKCEEVKYLDNVVVTDSQRELIKEEISSLEKQSLNTLHDKIFINKRLNKLKKILKDGVTISPNCNTIGFGTNFSIMIFDNDKTVTKRLEMIDLAVSLETNDEYIERISPLGYAVFGLKNNEEFIVQVGKFHYVSGIVYDISNKKEDFKTNNPLIYQKSKGSL